MTSHGTHSRNAIIEIIKEYDGKPCPSNIMIGGRLHLQTRRVADFLFHLVQDGVLEKHGEKKTRAFSVVATGERTLPGNARISDDPPKYSAVESGTRYRTRAAPLPPHVWYGPRDARGNPIRR